MKLGTMMKERKGSKRETRGESRFFNEGPSRSRTRGGKTTRDIGDCGRVDDARYI